MGDWGPKCRRVRVKNELARLCAAAVVLIVVLIAVLIVLMIS